MQAEHRKFRTVEGGQQNKPQPSKDWPDEAREDIDPARPEKHTLPIDEGTLEKLETVTILAGSRGQGENKDLIMHVKPVGGRIWYTVLDHQQPVHEGPSLLAAIDTYNRV